MPALDIKIYGFDPERAALVRTQDNEAIACSDKKSAKYRAMHKDDLRKIYAAFLQCKDWGEADLMSFQEAFDRYYADIR